MVLMENAGIKIFELIKKQFQTIHPVYIFCGKGNNGGDGLVVARHLINHSYPVYVFLTCKPDDLTGDTFINAQIVEKMGGMITVIESEKDFPAVAREGIILDGLLGTGVTGDVRGLYASIISWINQQELPVISIDLPSGLNADTGDFGHLCVHADYTVTMGELKRGILMPPGAKYAGDIYIADIGFPRSLREQLDPATYVIQKHDIAERLPHRASDSHKGNFGKVFILAGSRGMTGAAILSSSATLRAGAGLAKLGIPQSLNCIIESRCFEVISVPLDETASGTLASGAKAKIHNLLDWADVFVLGPGLTVHAETTQLVRELIEETSLPMVLDADGITMFEEQALFIQNHFKGILTPHPGELSKLSGISIADIIKDPIEIARSQARILNNVLVLKGSPTVIASPEGDVYINSTGNSGLATGGSGDVLTGIIGGLLAQNIPVLDAAVCGVYLHGLAADIAVEEVNERSLIASDLLVYLSEAFNLIEEVS